MKKTVIVDRRGAKEIKKFPSIVQNKFRAVFAILESSGRIEEPVGKKLEGNNNLFEIRIKFRGQWRALYAYIAGDAIIILSAFIKKTQRTPPAEIEKAKKRLNEYK